MLVFSNELCIDLFLKHMHVCFIPTSLYEGQAYMGRNWMHAHRESYEDSFASNQLLY